MKHNQIKVCEVDFLDLLLPIQTTVLRKMSELEKDVKNWKSSIFLKIILVLLWWLTEKMILLI